MSQTNQARPLREYVRVVARRKWIIIASILACATGALVMVVAKEPVYQASAFMAVRSIPGESLFGSTNQAGSNTDRAIRTEIRVLESDVVFNRVREDLGIEGPIPRARGRADSDSFVVSVSVRSGDPQLAKRVADAYVQAYLDLRREEIVAGLTTASAELENQLASIQEQIADIDAQIDAAETPEEQAVLERDLGPQRQILLNQQAQFRQRLDQLRVDAALSTGGAQLVQPARVPGFPVEPTPRRTLAIAVLFGLLLGLGAAFLIDFLDDSIDDPRDLEEAAGGSPVLSIVPTDPPPDHLPVSVSRPGDTAVEAYRTLRTSVQFLGLEQPLRIVQITSSVSGEGKTTTASNLAVVLAQAGNKVLVVDADLRRPRVHEVFGIDGSRGLTDALVGEAPESLITRFPLDDAHLDVLAAGRVPPNPSEMLGSRKMKALLESLTSTYDVVVVDSAPVLPVTDSVVLTGSVDAVLLVVQAGRASSKMVRESVTALTRVSAPLAGVVMNRARSRRRRSGYGGAYGYGYGYGYGVGDTR